MGNGAYQDWGAGPLNLLSGTGQLTSVGGIELTSSVTGTPFGVNIISGEITVPTGYISGASLSSSMTFAGKTLAGLSLLAGTSVYGYGAGNANTITIQVGGSGGAVPEPGEWAAMGVLGLGLTGLVIRKRRKG